MPLQALVWRLTAQAILDHPAKIGRVAPDQNGRNREWLIGCRHCYDMVYECQRRGERSRSYYQASKIRLSLDGAPSIAGPFPERPRRMWRKTYERLRKEAEALELPLRKSRFAKREADYTRFSFY